MKLTPKFDPKELKAKRDQLRDGNRAASVKLSEIPKSNWPPALSERQVTPERVFRSKTFLVQIFDETDGAIRMSVARTELDKSGHWKDGISWEELQNLKREAGYGSMQAVEIYPPDWDVVNVANMRHLWIMLDPLPFQWRAAR